jgi:hypothetical protein
MLAPPESGAAFSGPAVLDAMLEQIGPASTILVRQRVESVAPEFEEVPQGAEPFGPIVPEATGPEVSPSGGVLQGESTVAAVPREEPETVLPPVLTEELIYQLPGGFRAEIRTAAIQRLYLEVDGEALLVVDGRRESIGGGWFEQFKDLFLFTRRLALHRHLANKGVDLAVTSLGLWEADPVFVLGARFPDAAPAQIWVDRETLLPLRWLWQTPANGAVDGVDGAPEAVRRFEIRFDRWQRFGKRRYPLRVQFFEDYELVRTLFAESIVVDAEVDASLMDLEAVRQTTLPPEEELLEEDAVGDPAVDEIQEAIDIFKKRYE